MTATQQYRVNRVSAVAWYAIIGVVTVITMAIVRLSPYAIEALSSPLSGTQVVLLALWMPFMAWSEGYRGFQKRFSPRVVNRALGLGTERLGVSSLAAPFIAMGFVRAERRVVIAAWALSAAIVCLMLLLRIASGRGQTRSPQAAYRPISRPPRALIPISARIEASSVISARRVASRRRAIAHRLSKSATKRPAVGTARWEIAWIG